MGSVQNYGVICTITVFPADIAQTLIAINLDVTKNSSETFKTRTKHNFDFLIIS